MFTPTPEQSQIAESIKSTPSSLMISAYAGTAKTTTLTYSAPGIRVPALALAFNKKIAEELRPKLPGNFTTKTLNGLGHSAWVQGRSAKIDDRKLGKLVTQIAKDNKVPLSSDQWDTIRSLVSQAMLAGISPQDRGAPLKLDTPANWADLDSSPLQNDPDFPLIHDLSHQVLAESIKLAQDNIISFDDQIYCPTILGGHWPQFPCIFIDESQDLSPLNHRMLELALRPEGRLVAVGDSRQAIYAFRGADAESMNSMRRLSSEWTDLGLTTTFRCPKVIVTRQQSHAPGFTAWEGCQEGRIATADDLPADPNTEEMLPIWSMNDIKEEASKLPNVITSLAILCRNNAPLLSLAFKLLRRNIGCHMLGRDIGRGLINLSKKLSDSDSQPITKHVTALREWESSQVSLALANDNPDRAERIRDQAESLAAVAEGSGASTSGELRAALTNLFQRSEGLITLSTIHKAKGLEWDLVIHLDPWRIPSKLALRDHTQLIQEHNLLYVAETRTRHTLLNLNLADFR